MFESDDSESWLPQVRGALDDGWYSGPGPEALVPIQHLDRSTLAVGVAIGLLKLSVAQEILRIRDGDEGDEDERFHIGSAGGEVEWATRKWWYSRV